MDNTTTHLSSINQEQQQQQQQQQSKQEASDFLHSLLNKNLRVTTTDSRMFHGTFKCTDSESNIILQHTYEYRPPTHQQVSEAAAAAAAAAGENDDDGTSRTDTGKKVKVDMTSRYLGLVVVPGQHIVRIEVEEFTSQTKGRGVPVQG
ncbi:hypothetical protein VTK56DRAFT_8010 [Thermocarpiscus australiensis]